MQRGAGSGGKLTGRIRVRELAQREGLKGKVLNLFPSWHIGIIHGDDGYDVTFREDSLVVGFSYAELSVGREFLTASFFLQGPRFPLRLICNRFERIQQKASANSRKQLLRDRSAQGMTS